MTPSAIKSSTTAPVLHRMAGFQSDVDAAPTYPELLRLFKATFIEKHALFTRDNRTVWVTDGPWGERDLVRLFNRLPSDA